MNSTTATVCTARNAADAQLDFPVANQRPSFRLSDIWKTPLHDFPIRDEILYQWLPMDRTDAVLEIGSGSGFTAFRLSRRVAQITSLDIAPRNVEWLRETYAETANLRFACADVSSPDFLSAAPGPFDAVFGLDFFQFVTDPRACLENLAAAVRPGGTILLQWPNYPPSISHGVTYISTHTELSDLLLSAGLHNWQAFALHLTPHASALFKLFHEFPLRPIRRYRRSEGKRSPQTFDETWAFQKARHLELLSALVHTYWTGLSAAMRIGRHVFLRHPLGETDSLDCNLMLLARR